MKILTVLMALFLLWGCASILVGNSMRKYEAVRDQIQLGDSEDKVLSVLLPTESGLPLRLKKQPETYLQDKSLVKIHYARSGFQSDGLTTDDEFTPYVFKDGKLIAIGWQYLGGPKSVGQVVPITNVNVNNRKR
ncbi:MAG: hypothetical protein LHV69_02410 [Elusimicrobia bacterium]|nr:hypothetical protein [Candidatus Obscuribacterium magneticum]MCB4755876.1 hypothetical protein [Candidatus Obscuribacterium magneticum]